MKKNLISAVLISAALIACKSTEKTSTATTAATPAPTTTETNGQVTFLKDIKPIMDTYCTRCHNTNEKAGYNFEELSFVKKAASNGYLLGSIKHERGYDAMPANADKLDNAIISKIESWIKSGMN